MAFASKENVFEIEARRCLSLASETHDALLAAKMRMLAAEFSKRGRQKTASNSRKDHGSARL